MQKVGLSKDGVGDDDFISKMKQFVKCQTQYLGKLHLVIKIFGLYSSHR